MASFETLRTKAVRTAMAFALLMATLGFLFAGAGTARAETYTGYVIGPCASAAGSTAYRSQLKIPVSEAGVTTGFMTMNVEWCTNGSRLTYGPVLASSTADRTQAGVLSNLARTGYTSSYSPPTAVGGPATIGTSATWDREIEGSLTAEQSGIGASVTLNPANFNSNMSVVVYPSNGTVVCTGSSPSGPEPCTLNY